MVGTKVGGMKATAYEEPKEDYWYIKEDGTLGRINLSWDTQLSIENHKLIGNYFETAKEAEQAVKKLKAWKRLKDKGFRFYNKTPITDDGFVAIEASIDDEEYIDKDLDLLFGGEE